MSDTVEPATDEAVEPSPRETTEPDKAATQEAPPAEASRRAGRRMDALVTLVYLLGAFWVTVRARTIPFARKISAPPEKVRDVIPAVFQGMGYEGGFGVHDASIFSTKQLRVEGRLYDGELNSRYFDCGNTPAGTLAADEYQITFVMFTRILSAADGTAEVEIVVDGTAHSKTLSSTFVYCRGTGRLENAILGAIALRATT